VEPLTLAVTLATRDSVDTQELASVAARTFPLACPPSTSAHNIASFVAANLSAARFAEFVADPQRAILTAAHDGRIVGYAMLVRDVSDGDIPTAELSKLYVSADFHGAGVSTELMDAALATALGWGVRRVWLGVNQENQRAQRFYAKSGFTVTGTRTFQLGDRRENDFLMVRELCHPARVTLA
jgi:ribosomal protein S18 acetylase RimI-like enzyme